MENEIQEQDTSQIQDVASNQLESFKKQAEDYLKGWQTERANLLNYQRDENDRLSRAITLNERNLLLEIISILDNFDLILKNLDLSNDYSKGIQLIYEQFTSFLNRHQCFAFESLNQVFDPNLHEAIEMVKDDIKDNNIVVEEVQKGYKLNNIVIRPSKVKVNQIN